MGSFLGSSCTAAGKCRLSSVRLILEYEYKKLSVCVFYGVSADDMLNLASTAIEKAQNDLNASLYTKIIGDGTGVLGIEPSWVT